MSNKELIKTSLSLEKEKYRIFKKLCKLENSDSSKEIRKMISKYLEKRKDLVLEILKEEGN